ncbi:MAG: tetratricopeptide repeat protein [Victivallaceae bacterium]|nr:tetratricopeptide repeat protein [Victivallaceae bacterium]
MERKKLNQVSISVRESYNRVAKSTASVDVDSAVDMMKDIVKLYPDLGPARDRLRELERHKSLTQSALSKIIAVIGSVFMLPVIRIVMSKNPVKAMAMCEDQLAKSLDNPMMLNTLADAGRAADAPFVTAEALRVIFDLHPANEVNARKLVEALQSNNQAREALKVFSELAARHPRDLEMQAELRSIMALASMERGKWEEEGSSQQKANDKDAQVAQQLMDGTIHDADQAHTLIEKFTADLAANDSVDIRRKLAEAYLVAKDYDSAIREMKMVAKKIGALDPMLDKSIERAYIAQINQAVDELKNNPAAYDKPEEQIAALTAQREDYRLHRAQVRVDTYPNDALLHFDLGEIYFERGNVDGALVEYQQAMRSPQKRTACLLKLGRCFEAKGQYDIAVEQYQAAMKDMIAGTDQRLETVYYLGNTYEKAGDMAKAIDCYKDIYQSRAGYRDVAKRINDYYSKHAAQI